MEDPTIAADQDRPNHRLVLGVTGSIAAYKSLPLLRALQQAGVSVEVVLTEAAKQFVGAESFAGLLGQSVGGTLFGTDGGERHVQLAAQTDAMLIAPCTADTLARLAHGRAGDLLSATALCTTAPIIVAPAMHPRMWNHPATQANVKCLQGRGVLFLGPTDGRVASGDVGVGRFMEPEDIARQVLAFLYREGKVDLAGRHVAVTAGPTFEDLDPVRFIANRSSGKMGFALAAAAQRRGAQVSLIAGPVQLPTPYGVARHDIRSALELKDALQRTANSADLLFMAAAVGDYRVSVTAPQKLKREQTTTLNLVANPDIVAEFARQRTSQYPKIVAFAVETGNDEWVIEHARAKLVRKGADMIVANHAQESLGRDTNRVHVITRSAVASLPKMNKRTLADALLDHAKSLWSDA